MRRARSPLIDRPRHPWARERTTWLREMRLRHDVIILETHRRARSGLTRCGKTRAGAGIPSSGMGPSAGLTDFRVCVPTC